MAIHPALRLYDTPKREIVPIEPQVDGLLQMYTCGPTVYKEAHVGNMRAYVAADMARRAASLAGLETRQVINITDVGHLTSDADSGDDKMAKSAREQSTSAWDIAKQYESLFWEDIAALRISKPEVVARATEHIPEQIELIEKLAGEGFTYTTEDGVYFDSSKYPEYGDFAKLDIDGIKSGARVSMGAKKHAHDFALWKFPPEGQQRDMIWDSPWGAGFPGWHIECSAMAIKHLGDTFDLHSGGIDHIPIHHTNEIAQARAAGYGFAEHWMHVAFLNLPDGEKMSKSGKQSLRLPDVLGRYSVSADALRYAYLSFHYRSPMVFDESTLQHAQRTTESLYDGATVLAAQAADSDTVAPLSPVAERQWSEFKDSILNDLNTPVALSSLNATLKNKHISPAEKQILLTDMDTALGLGIQDRVQATVLTPEQKSLIDSRKDARTRKDFRESDAIRQALHDQGIKVIDLPGNTQIVRKV